MKIFLNIEADSPAELDQAIAGLAAKLSAVTQVAATIAEPAAAGKQAAPSFDEQATAAEAARKPRAAKPKAEAAPKAEEPKTEVKEEPKVEEAKKPADLTADEIKSYVIDWLNDLTEAEQKKDAPDAEVRVKALRKLTEAMAGEVMKLSEMIAKNQDKWPAILAYVDERRAELTAATAETSEEE